MLSARSLIIFSECAEREFLHFCITYFFMGETMTCDESSQILIHHHNRLAECVKQDSVCSFWADSRKIQQLLTRLLLSLAWKGESAILRIHNRENEQRL